MNKRKYDTKIPTLLKWKGGRNKSINEISKNVFLSGKLDLPKIKSFIVYNEIGVGSGTTLLFVILNNIIDPKTTTVNAFDKNKELINFHKVVKNHPAELINIYENDFHLPYNSLKTIDDKKKFYNNAREKFNNKNDVNEIEKAGLFLFLNKTCFRGIYRETKKGKFNSPFDSSYKGELPNISTIKTNIMKCSKAFENVNFYHEDFDKIVKNENEFYFIDIDDNDDNSEKIKDFFILNNNQNLSFVISKTSINGGDDEIKEFLKDLYSFVDDEFYASKKIITEKSSNVVVDIEPSLSLKKRGRKKIIPSTPISPETLKKIKREKWKKWYDNNKKGKLIKQQEKSPQSVVVITNEEEEFILPPPLL